MFNFVLENGLIIDGSGSPWFKADVGIEGGKIEALGNLKCERAEHRIDLKGLVVTPGFIDPHSHSDVTILKNNTALSSLQQGITTECVGNCGGSNFPITDKNRKSIIMRTANAFDTDLDKVEVNWTDFAGFRKKLEEKQIGVNLACFVGHNTIRSAVMGIEGEGGKRPTPTEEELKEMKCLVAQAMEQGCWGMTTGLVYKPGRNAKTEEVIELARIAADYGGTYISHIRSYRSLSGIEEFLEIVEKASIKGVASHQTMRWHTKKKNLVGPTPEEMLLLFDDARKRGAEVYMDILPWNLSGGKPLFSILLETEEKFDEQGRRLKLDQFMDMLRDPEKRKEIEDRARARIFKVSRPAEEIAFGESYTISRSIRFPEYVEHTLAEIAEMRGTDVITTVADIILEDKGNTFHGSWDCEGDIRRLLKHPAAMVATDGQVTEIDSPYVSLGRSHSVRLYGSFPKVLGVYVREERLLPLEEAVRKMTSLTAQAIGITNRGLIRPGMCADIVVFDPDKIAHMATHFEPRQYCVGYEYVLVNGEFAMEEGKLTEALAGKVLIHETEKR